MVNALSKIGKVTADLDDEKIAAFADRIEKLNTALEPLSTKMTTIQTGLKAINSSARSAGSAVKQMGEDVDASAVNFASFIYIVQEAVQWIQAAVERFSQFIAQAIEWDGIAARFGRGFGPQAQETYEWIQRLNEEMGINIQQFMQYSSIYATMLTGFGVAVEDATTMALGYTELTYDIWAGYNDVYKTFEEASEAVKSAIAGEVEPIRRAGFTIVESTLQQTAANHGLNISLEKASEAQKSYLRYLTLVDQAHAQNLVGTYAKELQTAEGLMRTFSQQLKSLSQAFGSLFLPALTAVMPYLQAFIEMLTSAIHWIANLFGIKIMGVDWSGFNSGVSEAVENTENLGSAIGGAGAAAKELKNATIGIDELNVISPPSGGGGGGGGGGLDEGAGFEGLDIESLWDESIFADIGRQVDEIKEKFRGWMPVLSTIAGILAGLGLTSLIMSIGEAIAEMNVFKKAAAAITTLTIQAMLVFLFADNYLESGNLINLVSEAIITAASGYLLFKAWGPGGAVLSLSVSILAQLMAVQMSLADGTITLSSPELWIQSIATMLMGAFGGALIARQTGFFVKEGFVIGLAVTAALTLSAIRLGAIESGEIDSGSVEAWIMEIGSVLTAGLAGKWLGTALYSKGGPMGALIGVTAGLVLNLVGTISVEGGDFGDSISDWINVGITTAMTGFTAVKLWGMIGPAVTTALSGLLGYIAPAVTTVLGGLGTAIAAIGGGWAVAAIAAIVGIITLAIVDYDFSDIGEKLGRAIGKMLGKIGDFFGDIGTFISNVGKAIKDGLDGAIDWVVKNFEIDSIADVINLAFNPVAWITKILPKMIEVGKDILPGLWQGITDTWDNFWGNIGEFIDGFIQGFKDGLGIASPSTVFADIGHWLIEGLWNGILGMYDTIVSNISDWVSELIGKVKSFFGIGGKPKFETIGKDIIQDLWDGISGMYTTVTTNVSQWVSDLVSSVKSFFGVGSGSAKLKLIGGDIITDLWNGISGMFNTLVSNVSQWVNDMVAKVKEFFGIGTDEPAFKNIGGELVQGIIDGIQGKATTLWNELKDWADGIIESVKTFFDVNSPSKKFEEIGGYLKDGLVEGFTDGSALLQPVKDMWNKAEKWMEDNFEFTYTPSVGSLTTKLKSSWESAKIWWSKSKGSLSTYTPSIGSIQAKLSSVWSSAKTWWSKKKGSLSTYTPSIGSISGKLSSSWSSAKTWWNKKKGSLSYTPSIGSLTNKLKSSWDSAKKWWNKNVRLDTKLNIKVPTVKVKWETASAFGKSFKYPKGFDLKFAAAGGMFDTGSLIWAGERGPEVVANAAGGKTGVMNVNQMQDAVFEGVYAAVMAAQRSANGDSSPAFNIYLDGKQITATVEKRQRERGSNIMGNQVYTYG